MVKKAEVHNGKRTGIATGAVDKVNALES